MTAQSDGDGSAIDPGSAAVARPQPAKPPARPRELEDWLNHHLYHPLAWRLARLLARTPVTPNQVSIAGAGCVIAAGIAYTQPTWSAAWGVGWPLLWPLSALLGLTLHMAWHVVDGADGDLARITGRASPVGEMVDGVCDYVGHIALYLMLGWMLARQFPAHPAWCWVLTLGAGASHAIQANHAEVERRSYQWWVYGKPWLGTTHGTAGVGTRRHIFAKFAAYYLTLADNFSAGARLIDAQVAAALSKPGGGDAARLAAIRAAVRGAAPPLLRLAAILGPNPRAILLGLSMLAGSALWYFLVLVVGLNLLLAWSVHRHNAAARRIVAGLGTA